MPIQTTCGECGKAITVADKFAGKRGKCKDCGGVIEIPAASRSAEETAAIEKPRAPARKTGGRSGGAPNRKAGNRATATRAVRNGKTARKGRDRGGREKSSGKKKYLIPAVVGGKYPGTQYQFFGEG